VTATRLPPLARADSELFAAARLRAARLQPYLASAVFSLIPVDAPGYGTFAVDRHWRVYVDMEQARRWGVEATAAVLLHEAHHVVRNHHERAARLDVDDRTHRLWNLAGDAAINDDLVAEHLPLPNPILPRHLGVPTGGFEEQYFQHLLDEHDTWDHETCGSGSGGAPAPVETSDEPADSGVDGVDDVDATAIRRAVAHDVVNAADRGDRVSPGLVLWARDLLDPQVPWRQLLRGALGRPARSVTSRGAPDWTRPDRRADSRPDFPRPGLRHHSPEVAVVVDTSASMERPLLDAAVTEINGMLRRTGVTSLTVIVCDVDAARPQRVRRLGDLALRGGGGTDMRVGIDAASAGRPRPSIIVVLTDGYTPWPGEAPVGTTLIPVILDDAVPLPAGPGITPVRVGGDR